MGTSGTPPRQLQLRASPEEGGKYGMRSMSERKWSSLGPWPRKSMSSDRVQITLKYDMQPANRGDNPWKDWARGSERGPARVSGTVLFHYTAYVSR